MLDTEHPSVGTARAADIPGGTRPVCLMWSFAHRSQLGKQFAHEPTQLRQVILGIIPDAFGPHACVAVDQQVAEIDDPAKAGNPLRKFGVGLVQAVQRLADDLELAFDRTCVRASSA